MYIEALFLSKLLMVFGLCKAFLIVYNHPTTMSVSNLVQVYNLQITMTTVYCSLKALVSTKDAWNAGFLRHFLSYPQFLWL